MDDFYRAIDGWPGYWVGRDGSVWHYLRGTWRELKSPPASKYSIVSLSHNGIRKTSMRHILILQAFVGPCPRGMQARHLNDVKSDNRLENLKWGTRKENMLDRDRNGYTARGERQGSSKLTANDVREIRKERERGVSMAALGRRFGVSDVSIGKVVHGKRWRHVES